jgi:hypothetical protein
MLQEFVRIDIPKKLIVLPKICSLFLSDFVPRRITSPNAMDCLRAVVPYLKTEERTVLIKMMTEGGNMHVRFSNYDFRCRQLSLLPSSMLKSSE